MNKRYIFLALLFIVLSLFAFTLLQIENKSLEEMYKESYKSTFKLISFILSNYLQKEKEIESNILSELDSLSDKVAENSSIISPRILTGNLQGIWLFGDNQQKSATRYGEIEEKIIDFYRSNLKGLETHTFITLQGETFYLANYPKDSYNILMLYVNKGLYGLKIQKMLDSLVTFSELNYYSVLGDKGTPLIYSSLYENFLPRRGTGSYKIKTPLGPIFHIERIEDNKTYIAGFSMLPIEKIRERNNSILTFILISFIILEGVFIFFLIRLERSKTKKEEEIKHLKEINALSSGFAHEFRNSLNTLSLMAKTLDSKEKNILRDEIHRMQSVMDSLKLITKSKIKKEEIKILDVIEEALSAFKITMQEKKVVTKKEIEKDLKVKGNRALLVTAISNLLKNSLEANANVLKIRGFKEGKKVYLDFIDNGSGIKKEYIEKIFDPFFSKKEHSGLGLYLTRKIIEAHGGSIQVESKKYTDFKIILGIE